MLRIFLLFLGLGLTSNGAFSGEPLRVCADSRPSFLANVEGEPVGLEHDILAGFAESQNRELEIVWISFTEIFDALNRGDCEIVAAVLTPTPDRLKIMSFSDGYFPTMRVLVTRKNAQIRSVSQLEGKILATLKESSHIEAIEEIPGAKVVLRDRYDTAAKLVASGEADGLVCDSERALGIVKELPALKIAFALSGREQYAFAMRKDSQLPEMLNAYIQGIREDGSYTTTLRRYFDEELLALVLE